MNQELCGALVLVDQAAEHIDPPHAMLHSGRGGSALPTENGFSSPYQLRNRATGTCLHDLGDGQNVLVVTCESFPSTDSAQLWQHHRTADRTVAGREYSFRFNRFSGRVLSAIPAGSAARVVSAPAEPISKSGAADHQLWVMLAAA